MSTKFGEALTPLARLMPRTARDIEILRVAAQLDGDDYVAAATRARSAALAWAKKRAGGNLPKDAWDHQDFEFLAGGRNSAAVRFKTQTADLWALRAEDPDKDVAGRIWTTEIVIGGEAGKRPQLSLRLIVSTTEAEVSIEPHVPGTVLQMITSPGLVRAGRPLRDTPANPRTENDAEDLCDHMEDPERRLPVIVVTLPEGESAQPLINDVEVAKATAGLARTVRLPAELTWVLTKRFGKFRSVFDGAVRVYLPGFSKFDDPYRHRLFLASPLWEPENAKACEVWLRRFAADHSTAATRLGKDVLDFAAVRTANRKLQVTSLAERKAPDVELLAARQKLIDSLERQLAEKIKEIDDFCEQADAAEERAKAAEQENRSLLYKIRQLQDALAVGGGTPTAEPPLPQNWSEFPDWLDKTFPDRIVLTTSARKMVRSPEYEDVGLVARAISWLANEQYARRLNGGGTTRDEEIEPGIRNAFCGGDTYETSWQGRRYQVDQHVKTGGNTRDPKRCLRIYYFWEPDQQQTVIDHLPAHRHTSAT